MPQRSVLSAEQPPGHLPPQRTPTQAAARLNSSRLGPRCLSTRRTLRSENAEPCRPDDLFAQRRSPWQCFHLRPLPHVQESLRPRRPSCLAYIWITSAGARLALSRSAMARIGSWTWWKKSLYPVQYVNVLAHRDGVTLCLVHSTPRARRQDWTQRAPAKPRERAPGGLSGACRGSSRSPACLTAGGWVRS